MSTPINFEKVFVVNLDSRPDRLQRFNNNLPKDWPFPIPERYSAIAGKLCPRPVWWKQGGGAWGCYKSHLNILEQCLNSGIQSVLLLEDDALFSNDFTFKAQQFLGSIPGNWDMLYFGGQHLCTDKHPPLKINEWVYKPWNVNRTHAFAVNFPFMRELYQHLNETKDWNDGNHIDHHLGRLHQRQQHNIYTPKEWIVGQCEGQSNISGKRPPNRMWKDAESIVGVEPDTVPFVVVTGLHSSGSSCLAGVLYHLGVHMGNKLGGYYGSVPGKECGYEAEGLASLCEEIIPFPSTELKKPRNWIWKKLHKWVFDRKREAGAKKTIAGCKYPQLCRLSNQLVNICGDSLRVINITRPIEESIQSLQRRCPTKDQDSLRQHQEWLDAGRADFISKANSLLTIEYSEMLDNPEGTVEQIINFLNIRPTPEQTVSAVNSINPAKRHITQGA